jgi:hypothetical protein
MSIKQIKSKSTTSQCFLGHNINQKSLALRGFFISEYDTIG